MNRNDFDNRKQRLKQYLILNVPRVAQIFLITIPLMATTALNIQPKVTAMRTSVGSTSACCVPRFAGERMDSISIRRCSLMQ